MKDNLSVCNESDIEKVMEEKTNASIFFVDNSFVIRKYNQASVRNSARYTNITPERKKSLGKPYYNYEFGQESRSQMKLLFTKARDTCSPHYINNFCLSWMPNHSVVETYWNASIQPVVNYDGDVTGLLIIGDDLTQIIPTITQRLEAEIADLKTTLRSLLKLREEDRMLLELDVSSNIRQLILPLVKKIDTYLLPRNQSNIISVIESNLDNVTESFARKLSSKEYNLTLREIQIINFITEGLTTKEIADILGLATGSIDSHRNNIRKKLGLKNKGVSLQTFLTSQLN